MAFYCDVTEAIHANTPLPRVKELNIHMFVDSNDPGDKGCADPQAVFTLWHNSCGIWRKYQQVRPVYLALICG